MGGGFDGSGGRPGAGGGGGGSGSGGRAGEGFDVVGGFGQQSGFDVVGVGVAYIDVLVQVEHLPAPDESMQVQAYDVQGGGKVATAMVAAARLGLRSAFVGPVGDDAFGDQIRAELQREGVDATRVQTQAGAASPFSNVLADNATAGRAILWSPGTVTDIDLTPADLAAVAKARFLHISEPTRAALTAARHARTHGVPVVWDADWFSPQVRELLPLVDICIASAHFVREFAPDLRPEAALDALPGEVAIITLGKDGLVGRSPEGRFRTPAFTVPVVDTTGAGDVFHGGYIAGLVKGYSPARAAVYASGVAALKCRALGGRKGIPTHQETLEFLALHNTPEV